MPLQLVTPPAEEPVSLAEAKAHLRVDFTDDDALIQDLIVGAREMAETFTERALVTQTWKYISDAFPQAPQFALTWQTYFDQFKLPLPPLQSVTGIVYTDQNGNQATVAPSAYLVDTASEPGRIALATGQVWPSTPLASIAGVAVTFVAGFGVAAKVPWSIKRAILLIVGEWYENREDVVVDKQIKSVELPRGADALLWRNRVPWAV